MRSSVHLVLGGLEHDGARVSGFFEPRKIRTLKTDASSTDIMEAYSACIILINTSCGISTLPLSFILFFPSFCLSQSFIFLVRSPPYMWAVTFFFMAGSERDEMIRPS